MREMDERGDLETSTDAEGEEEAKGECEMQATPRRRREWKAQTDEREKGAPKKGRHFE